MIASANDRFIPRLLLDAPDFRRLWLGQTISVLGDQVTQLGLPLVAVLTLGADASQMGTLTAVALLPHLLFSLPAGVWLDRVRSRRRLMVAADLIRAAAVAGFRSPLRWASSGCHRCPPTTSGSSRSTRPCSRCSRVPSTATTW